MKKSERELTQEKIVAGLEASGKWTAPYGILANLTTLTRGPGKVRTVTFGVARYLDAVATIWSPTSITVRGFGALADRVEGEFKSAEDFLEHVHKS